MEMLVGARNRLALSAIVLVPSVACAHDFRSLGYAGIVFLFIHLIGLVWWWRSWSFLVKLAYVLSFPLAVIVGVWLVNTFVLPDARIILVVVWCAPAMISFAFWFLRRIRRGSDKTSSIV
jgi:hypothetical protein